MVPGPAQAQASEVKLFLTSTGCPAGTDNVDTLVTTDSDSGVECFYTASGVRNEIGSQAGPTPVTPNREGGTRYWDAAGGVPLTLDATRPITGEIFTSGAQRVVGGTPESPVGFSAGQVILDINLVGTSGGKEVEIAALTDTFNVVPGAPHKTELKLTPDASLGGLIFETIELRTWIHEMSAGHGVVKTNGDFSSFISIPTASADAAPPPKKKKKKKGPPVTPPGCEKGKGKKTGCPQPPKGGVCAPYVPGEDGKDAPITVVTDAATADKPIEVTVATDIGIPEADITHAFHNVQVDSSGAETGLYARFEFDLGQDYDLYLRDAGGTEVARSAGFNQATLAGDGTGNGGHSEADAEQLDGIKSADCTGYTVDVASYFTEGGDYTLKLWLGEATYPAGPEALLYRAVMSII